MMTKDQVLQILRAIAEEFAAAGRDDAHPEGSESLLLGRLAQAYNRAADLVEQIDLKAGTRRRRRRTSEPGTEAVPTRRARRQTVPFK